MKIKIESGQQEYSREMPAQARFDMKAIETLVGKLKKIQNTNPEKQTAFRDLLFTNEAISDLLTRYEIQKDDAIDVIVAKLEGIESGIEQEARTVRPEETPVASEVANDNEREEVMVIQDRINELYRLNNEGEKEREDIDQELADLESFIIEKANEPSAIEATKRLVAQYEREIQELIPSAESKFEGGFLKRIFQGDVPQEPGEGQQAYLTRVEELKNNIMRKEEGLASKLQSNQVKEQRLHFRLQELQGMFEEPVEERPGNWEELVGKLKEALKKMQTKFDDDFEIRQQEIAALEQERDGKGAQSIGQITKSIVDRLERNLEEE